AGGSEAKRAFEAMMTMRKIDVAAIEAARRAGREDATLNAGFRDGHGECGATFRIVWGGMKIPRTVAVFLCAAGAALALAILKAVVISGLGTLPPVKVLVFAASTFGLVAALLDWALFRHPLPSARGKQERPGDRRSQSADRPPQAPAPRTDAILIERARQRPIVFREICPPPAASGLSFYGGVP